MMNKLYKLTKKTWLYPKKGEYVKYSSEEFNNQVTHRLLDFYTKTGELGLIDYLNSEPEGIKSINKVFDTLYNDYNLDRYKLHSIRRDAWRYFADKSKDDKIWHFEMMTGTPFKNNLSITELEKIKFLKEEEEFVENQEVTYDKWLNLSIEDKIKHMGLFLKNPVEGSDYILDNTFHI